MFPNIQCVHVISTIVVPLDSAGFPQVVSLWGVQYLHTISSSGSSLPLPLLRGHWLAPNRGGCLGGCMGKMRFWFRDQGIRGTTFIYLLPPFPEPITQRPFHGFLFPQTISALLDVICICSAVWFLATLVALHFTPVSRWVGRSVFPKKLKYMDWASLRITKS